MEVAMRRYVTEDLTLSNGLVLKKGTRLNIDNCRMSDPAIYENPEKYDPYRFYNMRRHPGMENKSQLVSTSSNHLGFGHGQQSCPGRFFAANEIKVALCHILVKYDWKLAPGTDTSPDMKGMLSKASSVASILIRKRGETTIDIDSL
jgi:cytochrome P450